MDAAPLVREPAPLSPILSVAVNSLLAALDNLHLLWYGSRTARTSGVTVASLSDSNLPEVESLCPFCSSSFAHIAGNGWRSSVL